MMERFSTRPTFLQQSDAVAEAIHSGDAPNSRRAVCNKALREMIDEQR